MEWSLFLDKAASTAEIHVVVHNGDEEARTPIWIVTAGGAPYVRSYRAETGHWYQHVRAECAANVEIGDDIVDATVHKVTDPAVFAAVSAAYRTKYAGEAEVDDMVSPPVVATTLELRPAGA